MTSDFKQSSPTAQLLNLGAMGPTSAYGGGSQHGSEYSYGNPQSPSIDSLLQANPGNQHTGLGPTSATNYKPSIGGIPANIQAYDHTFTSPLVVPGGPGGTFHPQHRGSMSSLPDGQSPVIGHHHRLSMSSGGPFVALERQNSLGGGSDTTSPDVPRGHGSFSGDGIGENPKGNNSNDTVNSQGQGDDAIAKSSDGTTPSWSELKTKAGKERKRLPLACIACRRKKIRCSGEKPACKHCLRSRIPCVYKVTTRKAAPRTDYMAMLDKRLKRMEDRVIKIIPKEEQGMIKDTGRANVKPPLPPPPPKSAGSNKKRAAEHAFGDELDEWANTKTANADTKQNVPQDSDEPVKHQDVEEHNLLREGADKLPPKDIQEHLSEVFFDYVYGQSYHLLHKPSFMRKLVQNQVPPVLMLAVCAIAARFSTHPSVRTEPAFLRGDQWASAARDIALRRYDTPNITILIVYIILGLHEFGTCQGGRSWMFGGMAQRMAYALQLHKDLDHDPKRQRKDENSELTFTDREIRRRTMWSCFLMDRFNSSGTDRPLFVGEQYIRAQLPIKEHFFNMEINGPTEDLDGNVPNPVDPDTGQTSDATENMGVAAYLIRLVSIWGKLVSYINLGGKARDPHPMWDDRSTFVCIKREVAAWKQALPDSLQYTPENLQNHASEKISNQFIFLHIVYNQIILFSNRFALPSPSTRPTWPKEMPLDFRTECGNQALEAANQISALVHEAMDHHVVAPFAGYSAFLSSTVHVNGAFSKNAALEVSSKQNLAWNVKYLTKMKKHWGMFHFITENLRDLYRKHADAARSGAKAGHTDEKGEPVFQYGDWFDHYPHGVSGTDYEEPQAEIKKEPGADAVLGQKSDLQTVEEFFSKLSPPSRAAQQQNQNAQRKMAKKRRSQSDSKGAASAPAQPPHSADGLADAQRRQVEQHEQMRQHLQNNMMTQNYAHHMNYPQSSAFPPGYQGPHNPLLTHPQQQGLMSELDRQMVLSSYAGIDPHATTMNHHSLTSTSNPMLEPSSFGDLDFNNMANTAHGQNGNGFWGDPSSAWFMPFNMDPPTIGDDNNLFNNGNTGFDWTTSFSDFGNLPPTGLTPRPPLVDMDSGQDLHGDDSGNMGNMDHMQH